MLLKGNALAVYCGWPQSESDALAKNKSKIEKFARKHQTTISYQLSVQTRLSSDCSHVQYLLDSLIRNKNIRFDHVFILNDSMFDSHELLELFRTTCNRANKPLILIETYSEADVTPEAISRSTERALGVRDHLAHSERIRRRLSSKKSDARQQQHALANAEKDRLVSLFQPLFEEVLAR